jgi:alpha/beta superfamily hydrolase
MSQTTFWFGSLLALSLLTACEKKSETTSIPAPAESAAPVAQPAPAAAAQGALATTSIDMDKVPVEEQYEAEAHGEITPQNFVQQIDALEKEIQAP